MQLQSNLAVLLEFDLNRLLAVQSDVTLLISRRVRELLDRSKELGDEHSTINDKDEDKGDTSIGIVGGDRSNHQMDDGDDSDDFILTQLGEHTGEKIWTHENEDLVTLRAELPKADISSPLKESQSLPDSYNHMKNDSRELDVQVEEDELPSANNNSRKELSQVTKKLCVRFPDNKPVVPRTNFNINPYTGKPWILEDFKRNEDINSVKKRQQNMKAQKIYAEGFPPPEAGRQSLIDKEISKGVENNFYEFENLRDRSHSPPGFGRLDFPNTQERFDDKQKSQNIIFHKTKWRFRKATCNAVPLYEREFLFKNDKLNEIVDDGTFEWNDSELQIYTRK
ncbi:hypothetical protein ZYGR_0P00980 [Zygosaccharomyces rouxii]|uniref:DNA endonuclease activator Ctp1 C-terminal domain-containing protein n=1 Tax=Zygosaccharomyces rouxii TaxID=4956 RepID=A0A1Q3A189_ZYGRO|nr:hypothetical protein ZYGR_0P00980 [Zygosaccharomyces rouxii]